MKALIMASVLFGTIQLTHAASEQQVRACLVDFALQANSYPGTDALESVNQVISDENTELGGILKKACSKENNPRVCLGDLIGQAVAHPDFDTNPVESVLKIMTNPAFSLSRIVTEACIQKLL